MIILRRVFPCGWSVKLPNRETDTTSPQWPVSKCCHCETGVRRHKLNKKAFWYRLRRISTLHTYLPGVHSFAQKWKKKKNLDSWSTLIKLLKSVPAPALHSNDRLCCMSATPWATTEEQRQQKHSWTECMHQHPAYKIISLYACEKAPVKHVSRARQTSKNLFFLCLLLKKRKLTGETCMDV